MNLINQDLKLAGILKNC